MLLSLTQRLEKEQKDTQHMLETAAKEITYIEEKTSGIANPMNSELLQKAMKSTPARIGIGRTGTRMKVKDYLQFRVDHAMAQDAVRLDVDESFIKRLQIPILETRASTIDEYLMDLDSGRLLSERSVKWLQDHGDKNQQVQIIISDGLSSSAVLANAEDLLQALLQGLKLKKISVGQPIFIKRGRVWVQDQVASIVNCDLVISLIGERPGLATAESLSAYIIYKPSKESVESDRTVISNIHRRGLAAVEAGAHISELLSEMLEKKASGVAFSKLKNRAPTIS